MTKKAKIIKSEIIIASSRISDATDGNLYQKKMK